MISIRIVRAEQAGNVLSAMSLRTNKGDTIYARRTPHVDEIELNHGIQAIRARTGLYKPDAVALDTMKG